MRAAAQELELKSFPEFADSVSVLWHWTDLPSDDTAVLFVTIANSLGWKATITFGDNTDDSQPPDDLESAFNRVSCLEASRSISPDIIGDCFLMFAVVLILFSLPSSLLGQIAAYLVIAGIVLTVAYGAWCSYILDKKRPRPLELAPLFAIPIIWVFILGLPLQYSFPAVALVCAIIAATIVHLSRKAKRSFRL